MTDDTFAYDSKQMERCRQSKKCKGKLVEICEKNLNANLYKYKELRRVAMQTYRGLLDLHPNNMAKNTFQLTLLDFTSCKRNWPKKLFDAADAAKKATQKWTRKIQDNAKRFCRNKLNANGYNDPEFPIKAANQIVKSLHHMADKNREGFIRHRRKCLDSIDYAKCTAEKVKYLSFYIVSKKFPVASAFAESLASEIGEASASEDENYYSKNGKKMVGNVLLNTGKAKLFDALGGKGKDTNGFSSLSASEQQKLLIRKSKWETAGSATDILIDVHKRKNRAAKIAKNKKDRKEEREKKGQATWWKQDPTETESIQQNVVDEENLKSSNKNHHQQLRKNCRKHCRENKKKGRRECRKLCSKSSYLQKYKRMQAYDDDDDDSNKKGKSSLSTDPDFKCTAKGGKCASKLKMTCSTKFRSSLCSGGWSNKCCIGILRQKNKNGKNSMILKRVTSNKITKEKEEHYEKSSDSEIKEASDERRRLRRSCRKLCRKQKQKYGRRQCRTLCSKSKVLRNYKNVFGA
jgi:hypothetical protein